MSLPINEPPLTHSQPSKPHSPRIRDLISWFFCCVHALFFASLKFHVQRRIGIVKKQKITGNTSNKRSWKTDSARVPRKSSSSGPGSTESLYVPAIPTKAKFPRDETLINWSDPAHFTSMLAVPGVEFLSGPGLTWTVVSCGQTWIRPVWPGYFFLFHLLSFTLPIHSTLPTYTYVYLSFYHLHCAFITFEYIVQRLYVIVKIGILIKN